MRESTLRMSAGALIGAAILIGAACAPDSSSITRPASGSDGARLAGPASAWSPLLSVRDGGHLFFPLELGNRWQYESRLVEVSHPAGGAPDTVYDQRYAIFREIVCAESLGGREYRVERQSLASLDNSRTWVWMRQDPRGLYEADVDISVPPECDGAIRGSKAPADPLRAAQSALDRAIDRAGSDRARAAWRAAAGRQREKLAAVATALPGRTIPGSLQLVRRGPPEGELLRLGYPLRPAANWIVRTDPRFFSWVDAIETLDMPAGRFDGYRVQIRSEFFGPGDRVESWYGRDGYLRMRYHLLSEAIDESGSSLGTLVDDYDEVLTGIALVGRSGGGPPKLAGR